MTLAKVHVVHVTLVACLASCTPPPAHAPAAASLGDARLVDPASRAPFVAAERYHGHVVVLDFWASWCAQCRETVPQVVRLADAYAAQGLVVIGVNAGESADAATTAARTFGITYPIALDPELAFSDRLGASGLPTLIVLDRAGTIVHRAKHVDEETLAAIRSLLSSSPSPSPSPNAASPSPAPPPP